MKKFSVILIMLLAFALSACTMQIAPDDKEKITEKLIRASEEIVLPEYTETDLKLMLICENGALVSWTSSDEKIISSSGVITRPNYNQEDIKAILTATITVDNQSISKEFEIIVKKEKLSVETINYTNGYVYQMLEHNASQFPYYKGYTYAGLIKKNGDIHLDFEENKTTKNTISVVLFGAQADNPDYDNTLAFQSAINSCTKGDEVFVPAGKYYFADAVIKTPYYAHIQLKAGVNMRGEGKKKSILVSNFRKGEYIDSNYGKKTATLVCANTSNSTISDLGFSANMDDSSLPADYNNTSVNNPEGNKYAPAFGIVAYSNSLAILVENIYIHDVYIEYFQYDGIRLYCTRNSKIANCVITKATDIGGGGAGYGIEIRGSGHEMFSAIDTYLDSCYNIVENNIIIGPFIRHGIILSYLTHNNLFYNNQVFDSADDAFDIHGQDEFLNVFAYNYAYGSRKGAGLGLGNTGSSHDESGYGNVIFGNVFETCRYGITVARGTQYTQLIKNTIITCKTDILISDGPNTFEENNIIK